MHQTGRVVLDVGGTRFATSRETLCSAPGTMLAAMFSGTVPAKAEEDGSFFVDRDPRSFEAVLNGLRRRIPPRKPAGMTDADWLADLEFLGFAEEKLQDELDRDKKRRKILKVVAARVGEHSSAMNDLVLSEMEARGAKELRCWLPLDKDDVRPLYDDIPWGELVYGDEYKEALAAFNLSYVVLNTRQKVGVETLRKAPLSGRLLRTDLTDGARPLAALVQFELK